MPDPDGVIENANLADKAISSRLLDDDLTLDGITTLGRLVADVATITQITATTFIGPYQTASTGQHIEIVDEVLDRIEFYTGDSFEAIPGFVRGLTLGTDSNRSLQISLTAPSTEGDADGTNIFVRSESQDDSTSPPRVVVAYGGGSSQTPEFHLQNSFRLMIDQLGTESAPAMGIGSNGDDGWFSPTDGEIAHVIGGSEIFRVTSTGISSGLAWQAWTLTFNTFTLGNGTVTARFVQIGNTVHFRVRIVFGSTTTIDGTDPRFSMPVTAASDYIFTDRLGVADLENDATNQIEATVRIWDTDEFVITTVNTAGTYGVHTAISATVPFTWTTGDTIAFSGTYEAAP